MVHVISSSSALSESAAALVLVMTSGLVCELVGALTAECVLGPGRDPSAGSDVDCRSAMSA